MKSLVLLLMSSLTAQNSLAAATTLDINKLSQALKESKAEWIAKPNAVSQLSRIEQQRRLGLKRDSTGIRFSVREMQRQSDLPKSIDWRNKDGANWVSPILDQGNCGSCVAFASVANLETQYKIASGFSAFNIRLSTQNAFSCGGGACDFGWFPEAAARYLMQAGVPDEACMPYLSGATGHEVACSSTCKTTSQRSFRISSYKTPSRVQHIAAVKQALQKGPLVTTLEVFADFMLYGGGIYKHVTGEMLGGHAVSIIGYDDITQSFIIRNSWGKTWGEDGFAHVSYDDVSGIGDETWAYEVPSITGAVSVESPLDYTYFSGLSPIKVHSTFANTGSLTTNFFDSTGSVAFTHICDGNDCKYEADLSGLADGRYEVQATAFDANGQKLGDSTRQFFFVANQKPVMELTFAGYQGTDLNRPLKGQMEIAVNAKTTTVPLSSVEFHYRGADGKDYFRAANLVVDGLMMGWTTNLNKNGFYEIWLVGRLTTNHQEAVIETPHKIVQVEN